MVEPTTKQVKTLKNGNPINKATQFGQPNGNPRNNGSWKKEDTPRFKLEQMMKLSEAELIKVVQDKDAPYFERKLASCLNKGDWKTFESMINQVYGTPKAVNETTVTGEVAANVNRPYIGLTTEEIKKALGEK